MNDQQATIQRCPVCRRPMPASYIACTNCLYRREVVDTPDRAQARLDRQHRQRGSGRGLQIALLIVLSIPCCCVLFFATCITMLGTQRHHSFDPMTMSTVVAATVGLAFFLALVKLLTSRAEVPNDTDQLPPPPDPRGS